MEKVGRQVKFDNFINFCISLIIKDFICYKYLVYFLLLNFIMLASI